ncbi:MAG: hypothetical protein ACU84Q_15705 [Gammaproteobacteria bacterium]
MALGEKKGDYSLKITSISHSEDGSSVVADCDGTATGFGTVLGTLIAKGEAGEKAGMCSWRSQAFLDNGDQLGGMGEGTWEECGKHKWRIRLIVMTTDGQVFASDGELDLASRSLNGDVLDWS